MAPKIERVPRVRPAPARLRLQLRRPPGLAARTRTDEPPPSSHDELVATKKSLEAVSFKLNGIDPEGLSDAQREEWGEQMRQVDLALARVRVSLLEGIVAEFQAQLPEIQRATAELEAALSGLQEAVAVIEAVSGFLGVIGEIVKLAG